MLPTITQCDDATFARLVGNLHACLASATDDQKSRGLSWYADALKFAFGLSEQSGYSVDIVCGVIAALSAQKSWEINQELARDAVMGNVHGQTADNCRKAARILAGESPRAVLPMDKKTGNFYLNLIGELNDAVTIDRHAARALDPDDVTADSGLGAAGRYALAAHVYRTVARDLGVPAGMVQAWAWTVRFDSFRWIRTDRSAS